MSVKSSSAFFLDPKILETLAEENRSVYAQADPFPHIVMDEFFPKEVLEEVLEEFPSPSQIQWRKLEHANSKKLASESESHMGDITRALIYQLNSSVFINFLERLTGIEGLIPDPHLWGGGLHQIEREGYLGIHADFNKHPRLQLDRRLNLLVYLNKDWKEEYGGHLELWDRGMKSCEKKALPIFNRVVIFNTTDFSYHGHPNPLNCPPGWTRKSLALYYYSNGRPVDEISTPHSTLYQRPKNDKRKSFFLKTMLEKISSRL